MTLLHKVLICLGCIVVFGGLSFLIFRQNQMYNRQTAIETQLVRQLELQDNIVRAQAAYATKDDIENLLDSRNINIESIEDDLDKLHARLVAVNTVSVHSVGRNVTNIPSTSTGQINPDKVIEQNEYIEKYSHQEQILKLTEPFSTNEVPFGFVGFSAWKERPWNLTVHPREYKITNVIGTDENERSYIYNKVTITSDNKDYDVKISKSETIQEYPEARWSFLNPKLFVGLDVGANINTYTAEQMPSLNIGFISYGRYKTTPTFSVLEIGLGAGFVSKKPGIILTPFAYNIGEVLPFIDNTYIAPAISVTLEKEFTITGGLRIGL